LPQVFYERGAGGGGGSGGSIVVLTDRLEGTGVFVAQGGRGADAYAPAADCVTAGAWNGGGGGGGGGLIWVSTPSGGAATVVGSASFLVGGGLGGQSSCGLPAATVGAAGRVTLVAP
jgi:hypothetical protein